MAAHRRFRPRRTPKRWRHGTLLLVLAGLFALGVLASGALGDVGLGGTSTSTDTTAVSTADSTTTADTTTADTTATTTTVDTTTTDTSSTDSPPPPPATTTTTAVTYTPSISSDQADYAPGSTVTLTGSGWPAGDSISVFTNDTIGQTWSQTDHVTADGSGNFTDLVTLPNTFISNYTVKASDASGLTATTTFTDSVGGATVTSPMSSSPTTLTSLPGTVTVHFTYFTGSTGTTTGEADVVCPGGSGNTYKHTGVSLATGGTSSSQLSSSIDVAVPATQANATCNASVTVTNSASGGANSKNDTSSNSVVISVPAATTISSVSGSGTYGGTATLTATLQSGGKGVSGESITFSVTGEGAVGSTTTNGSGVASLNGVALTGINAGTCNGCVSASFAGDSTYFASGPTTGDLSVAKAPGAVTINNIPSGALVGGSFTPTYTHLGDGMPSTVSQSTGICTVDGAGVVHFVAGGNCQLQASITAGTNYKQATGSTQSFTIANPDSTPPVVTITTDAADTIAGSGWYNIATSDTDGVLVHVSASDASGVANITCTDNGSTTVLDTSANPDSFVLTDGMHSITCEATDGAGNTGAASGSTTMPVDYNIDETAPSNSASLDKSPAGSGWFNISTGAPTVSFDCSDAGSGIATCPNSHLFGEGADQMFSGTAYDTAGNAATDGVSGVNVDLTAPTVDCTPPTPDYSGGGGWFGENVSVPCTASDPTPGSGLVGSASFDLGPTTVAAGTHDTQKLGPETVYDVAGNSVDTDAYSFQIDLQNPTIYDNGTTDTPTGFDGTLHWYDHEVTENFSADDLGGSGLAGSCATPWTNTTSGQGKDLTVSSGSCGDNVGNTNPGANAGDYNVDTTPPEVKVTGVSDGATYTLGSVPAAGCSTNDALSGVQTMATLGTSGGPVGSITVTCSGGEDYAGNTASPVSATFTVDYKWTGFLQPVDNPPMCNTVKAGSAIPVKFSLSGYQGMTIFWTGSPTSQAASCNSVADGTDPIEQTVTAGGSSLTYDQTSDQYVYVWKTDKAWAGTSRKLVVRLADGTYHYAYFSFTK